MKFPFFIICFLCFQLNHVVAQTDSLATKSFEELETLYLSTYRNPTKAKKYVDALCVVAQKGTNKQRISKAFYRKASVYLLLGDTKAALEFTAQSMAYMPSDDKELL